MFEFYPRENGAITIVDGDISLTLKAPVNAGVFLALVQQANMHKAVHDWRFELHTICLKPEEKRDIAIYCDGREVFKRMINGALPWKQVKLLMTLVNSTKQCRLRTTAL